MKIVISQPMFFPWVGMHEQLRQADVYVNYADVQYSKGSFTNRVQVKAPEGIRWLTVPLQALHLGQAIDEVQINNKVDWRQQHYELLARCYSAAPYYGDMMDVVSNVYGHAWQSIAELSQASFFAGCHYFGLDADVRFVDVRDLDVPGKSSQRVLDIVLKLGGDRYVTGHGARNYLDHSLFEFSGVRVEYMNYQKTPYPQMNGEFTPYVSILDLIANVGPQGMLLINSGSTYWKDFLNE